MYDLVKNCDIVIANEEDTDKVFGIKAPETNVSHGNVDAEQYKFVCLALKEKFPNLSGIAITLRGSISASNNTWSAVLWQADNFYIGPVYQITPIVDRVGGGDSFAAGLIYSLMKDKQAAQKALDFAVAASCLKHSIPGDLNLVSIQEVEQLASGDTSDVFADDRSVKITDDTIMSP